MKIEGLIDIFNGRGILSSVDFKILSVIRGNAYSIKYLWTGVLNNANVDIYIRSTRHLPSKGLLVIAYNNGGNCRSYTYRNTVVSANGIGMPLINNNFDIG